MVFGLCILNVREKHDFNRGVTVWGLNLSICSDKFQIILFGSMVTAI